MQKLNALAAGLQKEAEDQLGDEAHFSSDDEFDQICSGSGGGGGRGEEEEEIGGKIRGGRESGPSGYDSWSRDFGSRLGESSLRTARHSNHDLDSGSSFYRDDRFPEQNAAARDAGRQADTTTTTSKMEDANKKASRWDKYLGEEEDDQGKRNKKTAKENEPDWGNAVIESQLPTWKRLKMDQGGQSQVEGPSKAPGVREKLGVRRCGQETNRESRSLEDNPNGGNSDDIQERQQGVMRMMPGGVCASSSGFAVKTGNHPSSHLAGMTEDDWNEMLEDF